MKILAVDDDYFILELLTMICARIGYSKVETALSGDVALEMMNSADEDFECLLLDINMPGMDGIELCEQIRAMPTYRKTPIIMLTAMTEKTYIDSAFQAGATDYATKPIDIIELGARLRMAQEVVSARRELAALAAPKNDVPVADEPEKTFDISDEIQIVGFKELIEYAALANYILQLSRSGLVCSQVLAIKIDRIDMIFARASRDEFTYALTEFADTVHDVFGPSGYMMAYAGNGAFVLVSNKATLEPSIGLEREIQDLLDEKNIEYDNGDPLDIEISIGNPIRPSASKTHRIRKTFDRAIARAENRRSKKQQEPRPTSFRKIAG
ncbi:PleD family two-component system response regulator [Oceaniovalibus sp. ACAM 378]|uniref:response regulator n=1 Tax=Oceaniovalibus sp. ACAM 378 TaxID=2599923 RepID=UPI0011D3BA5B|nr:response regulator [Oceaniovalibus sp. ACAM 378]TYB90680.1 response regulator [Oceaniovalibus sp. ACAM 378]